MNPIRIVSFGGGGGLSKLLRALLKCDTVSLDITAAVTVADNGGSTGELGHLFGFPGYGGDLTKCSAALCPDQFLEDLLLHRFEAGDVNPGNIEAIFRLGLGKIISKGGWHRRNLDAMFAEYWQPSIFGSNEMMKAVLNYQFKGETLSPHSVKNLLFLAFIEIFRLSGHGKNEMLKAWHDFCKITAHRVIPVSDERTTLEVVTRRGRCIQGETSIDLISCLDREWHPHLDEIQKLRLNPPVAASALLLDALRSAHCVTVGPGDLYTTVCPALLAEDIQASLRAHHQKIIVIMNLTTKEGETQRYDAQDFLDQIQHIIGRPCDSIIFHNKIFPAKIRRAIKPNEQVVLGKMGSLKGPGWHRWCVPGRVAKYVETEHGCRLEHDPELLKIPLSTLLARIGREFRVGA